MKKAKTAKRVADEQVVAKLLANVPAEYVFFCTDGQIFSNMAGLGDALNSMSDETFGYHSNCDKRDFSNWLKDIVGDEELARDLANAATRMDAAIIVNTRIEVLKEKLV
jgi:hypothetical protein